jgi:hypothetical protein
VTAVRRALVLLLFLLPALALAEARDPAPLTEKTQWVLDLRWDRGDVYLVAVHKVDFNPPMTTPRASGRFALELTEHGTLVERSRFDFPGLGVPDPDGGIRMTARLRTRIGVFFPATSRGDKLELVDRASNLRWSLPWPPDSTFAGGGIPDAGGG